MTVEILCVGTELLLGNIVNTNGAYLAERLAALGCTCFYQSVVGDNEGRLTDTLQLACSRSDIVILVGGLGPTDDDMTKEVSAKVMGQELVLHEESKQHIIDYFKKRGLEPTSNNWKQAMMPKEGIVLPNPNGTAPGLIIQDETTRVILLPGPPIEMIPMFENHVVPYLRSLEAGIILSTTVKCCGIGESKVETLIKDLIDSQENPTIATYAKTGEVHIRVTAKAQTEAEALELMEPTVVELKKRLGTSIYTTEEGVTLEKAVVDLLLENGLTITCAESCTGGLLSARLINVSGVSGCYKAGFVTYANQAKEELVGVFGETLEKYTAVSEQTAKEMALGAAKKVNADVAVSVTGIAGPDGGTLEQPVGLVYIGIKVLDKVFVERFVFNGNRIKVRESAVSQCLTLIRKYLLEALQK